MENGKCYFVETRFVKQFRPRTSSATLTVSGTNKGILNVYQEGIGLPARKLFLENRCDFVILVDDLERAHADQVGSVFSLYRGIFDSICRPQANRAAVHFLVNMLEAYFFVDTVTTNAVLGTTLVAPLTDVEKIAHPKNELKALCSGFDEIEHGGLILQQIDLDVVLADPNTCCSLRTLIKWCMLAINEPITERFQLLSGKLNPVTEPQLLQLSP